MSGSESHLKSIGKAADDLGFVVRRVEPSEVELYTKRGNRWLRIEVHAEDYPLLDGDALRSVLRGVE